MMKRFHLIGIGGSGLSPIARLLLEKGYPVSGSDQVWNPVLDELAAMGAQVYTGHNAAQIAHADIVVRSSAIPDNNPEVQAARQASIPVLKRSEFLSFLMEGQTCIAIAATHGKTTTTAMTAWVLSQSGFDPSYIIGGISKNLASNAHAGKGEFFVIEADEYDFMFLGLEPQFAVVLNMEHDHPDCYPTYQSYTNSFSRFVQKIKTGGCLFLCQDQSETLLLAAEVTPKVRVFTFGFDPAAAYIAKDLFCAENGGYHFQVFYREHKLCRVQLQVPGKHNVLNALAVLAVIHQAGLPLEAAALALSSFEGTGRRFDVLGEVHGITIINDYAHHPTEIRTTLAAARDRYPQRRLWVAWQPHTYSRTRSNLDLFIDSLQAADRVVVTEVYASREPFDPEFSARQIVEKMKTDQVHFSPTLAEATDFLFQNLQSGDVLLVLSAGDAIQISASLLSLLKGMEVSHV